MTSGTKFGPCGLCTFTLAIALIALRAVRTNAAGRVGVVLRGRWLPQAELQSRLDSLAVSYRGP